MAFFPTHLQQVAIFADWAVPHKAEQYGGVPTLMFTKIAKKIDTRKTCVPSKILHLHLRPCPEWSWNVCIFTVKWINASALLYLVRSCFSHMEISRVLCMACWSTLHMWPKTCCRPSDSRLRLWALHMSMTSLKCSDRWVTGLGWFSFVVV